MDITDSATFGQFAVNRGLIQPAQLAEAMEAAQTESGQTVPDLIFLSRVLERKGYLTGLQTSKLMRGDPDGYFMGGYRLLYKIQSGSFGRVYRASDPLTGGVVAIKVLRRRWSEDQARIDLFVREGKVGLSLKHPNIVEMMAISQDPRSKQYYLVMEFVEGGNLREILTTRKTFTVAESLRMLEDCAAGLAYAYGRGITHRDIKLTNILVSTTGEAKLVDFGLAQMFASISRADELVDRTVTTPGLEKATDVKSGDVRSDLFFLGCVFFECLTGRSPLEMMKDRHARMAKRRFTEVQGLVPGEIDAPPAVYQLCETILAIDPRRRYQTPSQLLDAVKAARRELVAPSAAQAEGAKPATRTLFLAESDPGLQEALREKLKGLGYRVFLASDPARALDRYRQQPYDAAIIDVGTTGEDGLLVFERLFLEAREKSANLVGIALLSEDQADWAERLPHLGRAAVLVRPVTLKQMHRNLLELMEAK